MMRKLLIFFLLLFLYPFIVEAGSSIVINGPIVASAPYTCPSGAYLLAYDADHYGYTDRACFTNGTSTKDGTVSGGTLSALYGDTGVGYKITTTSEYIRWDIASNDGFNDQEGTICMSVKPSASWSDEVSLFYVSCSGSFIYGRISSGKHLYISHGAVDFISTGVLTENVWDRICFSWSDSTNYLATKICPDDVCDTESWESASKAVANLTDTAYFYLANDAGLTDDLFFDRLVILGTYQAADPGF